MFGHRFQNLVRYGGDVRACQSAVSHMDRVADAGGDDLRLNAGNGKNICDLADQIHTADVDVIQSSQERGNIRSAGSCGKQCLVGSEDQCNIRLDALSAQHFHSLQSFHGHRDLDNHVRVNGSDLPAFFDHTLGVRGRSLYLTADRSVHDGGDLFDYFVKVPAFLGDQGRVGRNTADNPHVICLTDVFHLCCVNKKLHNTILLTHVLCRCLPEPPP